LLLLWSRSRLDHDGKEVEVKVAGGVALGKEVDDEEEDE
jgi:hypothetical protein